MLVQMMLYLVRTLLLVSNKKLIASLCRVYPSVSVCLPVYLSVREKDTADTHSYALIYYLPLLAFVRITYNLIVVKALQ